MNAALTLVGALALLAVIVMGALGAVDCTIGYVDHDDEPDVETDDVLVEALRRGATSSDDELACLLAAWRDETRP